jgi:hypothetical protein
MPMSGSPEKRRDCIAQLTLRSPIFSLALNYVTTLIRLQQTTAQLGGCALPCLLTRDQAPSTNAARESKHVLPNSFYGNARTKFPKKTERRLSLALSSPARKPIRRCYGPITPQHSSNGIRVYDDAGNVIETHEHAGDFKEW